MYNFYSKKLVQPPGCAPNILLVMKLTTIILITAILQVSASTFAQKISLTEKNTPLNKIFEKISDQTGYDFLVSTENLKKARLVTINIQNEVLKSALDKIFTEQPLTFVIQEKMVVVSKKETAIINKAKKTFSIPIPFTGKVIDTSGSVLPGATIKIKGTDKIAVTDSEGMFTINAEEGDEIEVSFIGFDPYSFKVKADQSFQRIVLHASSSKLNVVTVVSTGYQTLPKERATGSFTTVNKELYNQQVTPDVISRLEYITNGLSVFRNSATKSSQLMIRGLSTINGPTTPLIVVDNFPYEGDLNNLNPNDVESVTVLKDAAAASIWGTRAGNGVIVITTKKGKYNQPLQIEINSNVTVGGKPDLNYLTPVSSADYISFERNLYDKGYYSNQVTSTQYPVLSPVVQLLVKVANGTITTAQANQQIEALGNNDVRNDFSKYMYQKAVNQQYHININGGNDKLAYLFSTGYDKDISNLAANYGRLNLRSQASFNPVKNLQLIAGITYTSSNNQTGKPGYGSINPLQPYQLLADAGGNALTIAQTYSQAFKDNAAKSGQLLNWNYNPLTDYQHSYTTIHIQDMLANFGAQYQIIKGLTIDLKYQYEKQLLNADGVNDAQSYYARNLINSFTQINGSSVTHIIPPGGILDQQNGTLSSHDLRGQINFAREWDKSSVSLLAGEELREITNSLSSNRNYGFNNDILLTAPVDYVNYYPNYVTQEQSTIPYDNALSQTLNRFVSLYANGSYTYDSKYSISGSVRRDGSNLFGVNTNDKWKPLWSSGLSWNIAKEKFYHLEAVPYLKVRATYGYSGNVDPGKSAVTTISYSGTSIYTNSPYSQVSNFANPDLRWEKIRTINFGLDFRSKNDRLYGSIDYYLKAATDLYATVPVDYTAGLNIATVTKNVAAMKGKGLDIEINSVNLNGEFKWITTLNFNYYRDKVTAYYLTTPNGNRYVLDSQNPVEGFPVWSVFSYKSAGLDAAGYPQGYLNGKLSEDYAAITGSGTQVSDLIYSGPRFPVFYGSLGNTFTYEGLSLSARITYGFGNYFKRQSIDYYSLATTGAGNADYAKRWQNPGDERTTTVPSMVYPLISSRENFYNSSEALVEKADCIRLQYVTFSYSLTKQRYPWLPFKGMQIYLNANNLGILWRANKLGIDPDYTYTNSVTPNPKSIALGLRVNL